VPQPAVFRDPHLCVQRSIRHFLRDEITKVIDNSRKGKNFGNPLGGNPRKLGAGQEQCLAYWIGIACADQPIAFDAKEESIGYCEFRKF
jgi:hypothetical protein